MEKSGLITEKKKPIKNKLKEKMQKSSRLSQVGNDVLFYFILYEKFLERVAETGQTICQVFWICQPF